MGEVYIDGQLMATTTFYTPITIGLSIDSRVIGVHITDEDSVHIGFIAKVSTGVVSDMSWKCTTSTPSKEWSMPDYKDDYWMQAVAYSINSLGYMANTYPPLASFAPNALWIHSMQPSNQLYCRRSIYLME